METLEGSYATYKKATANFISWIRNASKEKNAKLTERSSLSHIEEAVSTLCEKFQAVGESYVSNSLWISLPEALKSCRKAIEIRKAVGLIYEKVKPEDASNSSHNHFISSLERWYARLNELSQLKVQSQPTESDSAKLINIYENLRDIDEVEESESQSSISSTLPKTSASSPVEPALEECDDMFEKDLQLTLLCLLLDMEENMKRVVECWIGVKKGTETIITATVVTVAAINFVKGLEARLQLHYPAFTSYESICNGGICTHLPDVSEKTNLYAYGASFCYLVNEFISFIPFSSWGEVLFVAEAVMAFSKQIPSDNMDVHFSEGSFGDVYSEDENPLLDMVHKSLGFLCQQLPTYLSMYRQKGVLSYFGNDSLNSYFLNLLKELFDTKVVSLTLAFAVTCWMKSVMALQGGLFLGRCIYYTKQVITDINKRLDFYIRCQNEIGGDQDLLDSFNMIHLQWIHLIYSEYAGYCSCNPLLAGLFMVDAIFQYVSIGCQSLNKTSTFQAFGHLYHAMLDRQKLPESVPFLDDIQQIFKRFIYSTSLPEHGKFFDAYLLSSHRSVSSVVAVKKGKKTKPKKVSTKQLSGIQIQDLSVVYRALILQDYTCIVSNESSKGPLEDEHILDLLASLARCEQFQSRVLTRDILVMNDYISDMCEKLIDVLHLRPKYKAFLADPQMCRASPQWARSQAIQNILMNPLILMLDYVTQDGNDFDLVGYESYASKMNAVTKYRLTIESGKDAILHCLSNQTNVIAEVIASFFTTLKVDKVLHFLSISRTPILDEFGIDPIKRQCSIDIIFVNNGHSTAVIKDAENAMYVCMTTLERPTEPLTINEVDRIKKLVRTFPNILSLLMPKHGLPSIMYLACGGNWTNLDLVEWLIHMGGLKYQYEGMIAHETIVDGQEVIIPPYGKTLLHVAVEANHYEIVKLLVEYDHSKNLNTRTVHEGDTPIHIAVRMNHETIAEYLNFKGADLSVKNSEGKLVYQVAPKSTKNTWKKKYDQKHISSAAYLKRRGDRTNQFIQENRNNMERVNQMLEKQKKEAHSTNAHIKHQPQQQKKGKGKVVSTTTATTLISSSTVVTQAETMLQTPKCT